MKNFLLSAAKAVVYIVVLFCLLSFLGGFSDKQSILLALLFYSAFTQNSLSTEEQKFVPFSVFVAPNLYNILLDFDLVQPSEEGWTEIRAGIEKLSKEHWNIWNNKGFSFSFITRELIYNKDWQSFSTEEVDLNASLEPAVIVREKEKADSIFRNYSTLPKSDIEDRTGLRSKANVAGLALGQNQAQRDSEVHSRRRRVS